MSKQKFDDLIAEANRGHEGRGAVVGALKHLHTELKGTKHVTWAILFLTLLLLGIGIFQIFPDIMTKLTALFSK